MRKIKKRYYSILLRKHILSESVLASCLSLHHKSLKRVTFFLQNIDCSKVFTYFRLLNKKGKIHSNGILLSLCSPHVVNSLLCYAFICHYSNPYKSRSKTNFWLFDSILTTQFVSK